MAKTIASYGGITATEIKTKATIPAQSNMVVNGSNVDCQNISISAVETGMAHFNSSLYILANSNSANRYSNFGPRAWSLTGGTVPTNYIKTPYSLGDFAGYNHNALPPRFISGTNSGNVVEGAGTIQVTATISLGEVDWDSSIVFCEAVKCDLYINSSYHSTHGIDFTSTYLASNHTFTFNVDTSSWTLGNKTLRMEFYFCRDSAHDFTYLCDIPNINDRTITLTFVEQAKLGTWQSSSGLAATLGEPYAILIKTAGDITNSYVTQWNNTVTLSAHGIDTDNDGTGDLSFLESNRNLYYRINYGSWTYLGTMDLRIDNSAGGTYNLSTVTYGDIIDVEVR